MAASIISVLCIIVAVNWAEGIVIRRPWYGDERWPTDRRYLEKYPTTTESEETTTEQFYEKASGLNANKQQENVEKIFILSDNMLNWTEARSACLESGKMLANPSTPEQRIQLNSYIWDNDLSPPDVFSGYWLGGHREDDSGPFKWENGEEIIEGYYAGWMFGEPNYYGENCVELKGDGAALGFNNFFCRLIKRYICEEIVSPDPAKNFQGTNNNRVDQEKNTNVIKSSMFKISDLDEFGTILTTPREDLSEEVDTESPLPSEVSSNDQFVTILMARRKHLSGEADTESQLAFEISDRDQFDIIVVVPEKLVNDEVDPLTSENQFGEILPAHQKIISEEDTKSPTTSEASDYDEFLMALKKIISNKVDLH